MSSMGNDGKVSNDALHTDEHKLNFHASIDRFVASSQGALDLPRTSTALPPLEPPPGFAGYVTQFIHDAAPRPVTEVAVVGSLGLLAGICGRQWQLPGTGLNVYLILVARSAIGKEAMHDGISAIVKACSPKYASAARFADFAEYASGPALIKALVGNPCFVNVSGEIGHRIKGMANAKSTDPLRTLRTQMTKLYSKSAYESITGGITYSNADNNVQSVSGVSYSLIGETTPGTFLDSLTKDMMEDGFMSRLTVVEYEGDRPEPNPARLGAPAPGLVNWLVGMMAHGEKLAVRNETQPVNVMDSAAAKFKEFEAMCDTNIKAAGDDESRRQMWNRAHLKALRVAGLLAVGDNYENPWIQDQQADWAICLILRDIATFTKRLEGGDVGDSDDARQAKVRSILKDYLLHKPRESYKIHEDMRAMNIVPLHYLQKRTARTSAFYNHRYGAGRALDETLAALVAGGYIMEVQRDRVVEHYSYHGKGYRILDLDR